MANKRKVIFICSRNAARSQMAEGFLHALYGDLFEASSAGLRPFRLSRTATRIMNEIGIDISGHRSKSIEEFAGTAFDIVVTVCDEAACVPRHLLPRGETYLHVAFPDPGALAGNEEEVLAGYRRIRDQIRIWIRDAFGPGGSFRKEDLPGSPTPPDLQKT
jgi:arsenate reductase